MNLSCPDPTCEHVQYILLKDTVIQTEMNLILQDISLYSLTSVRTGDPPSPLLLSLRKNKVYEDIINQEERVVFNTTALTFSRL